MTTLTEADVEQATLDWLAALGWQVARAAAIGPGGPDPERADHSRVILERRLRDALASLNPALTDDAISDAFRKLTQPQGASTETRNRALPALAARARDYRHTRRGQPRRCARPVCWQRHNRSRR